jgi:hypothetical protein
MKILVAAALTLVSLQSFAMCVDKEQSLFCTGDNVIEVKSGQNVKIAAITANNSAFIKFPMFSGYRRDRTFQFSVDNLAVTKGCTVDDFCVGDKVMENQSGQEVTITGIYLSGKVSIKFSSFSGYRTDRNFSYLTQSITMIKPVKKRSLIIR